MNQIATATGDAYDFPSRGHFYHWVDVVVPTDGKVIAEHMVDATDAGAAKLAAHGLAARFPALTQRGTAWYFAGNYGDSAMDRGDPERIGILPFKNFSYRLGAHDFGQNGKSVGEPEVDERFFWRWYAPIVTRILDTRALNK